MRPHDLILALDSVPVLERVDDLNGPAGTTVTLTVQSPGSATRAVPVTNWPLTSPPAVTAERLEPAGVLLITIHTLWDTNTATLLQSHLKAQAETPAGIILDLRTNRGGSEANLLGCLAPFTQGTVGQFVRRDGQRPLQVEGVNLNQSQSVPLVVLVGRDTSSYAEVLAGVLQSNGRARLVGDVTQGNVETIWPHDFEDGSRLWLAEETFRPVVGAAWERNGVQPDYYLPLDWSEFTRENDPHLALALELLAAGN